MKSVINYIMIAILAINFLPMFVCASAWDEDFVGITLEPISSQSQVREGSQSVILYVSENSTISVKSENRDDSQLSCTTDTLITEYKLEFDGDGISNTGAANTDYAEYDSFLLTPVDIIHRFGDDEVVVTLYARARNKSDNVADSGAYSATQTLTVSW